MFSGDTLATIERDVVAIKTKFPDLSEVHNEPEPNIDYGYDANIVGWHDDLTYTQVLLLEDDDIIKASEVLVQLYASHFDLSGDYSTGVVSITV